MKKFLLFLLAPASFSPVYSQALQPMTAALLWKLGRVSGEEYLEQFVGAVQREVGVERNEAAIKAATAQLSGTQAE